MVYAPSDVKLRLSLFSLLYYTHRFIQAKLGRGHLSSISMIPTITQYGVRTYHTEKGLFTFLCVHTEADLACLLSPYSICWIKNFNFLTRKARCLEFSYSLHSLYTYTRKHRNCRRSPFNYCVQRVKTGSCPVPSEWTIKREFLFTTGMLEYSQLWRQTNSVNRYYFFWNLVCFFL